MQFSNSGFLQALHPPSVISVLSILLLFLILLFLFCSIVLEDFLFCSKFFYTAIVWVWRKMKVCCVKNFLLVPWKKIDAGQTDVKV